MVHTTWRVFLYALVAATSPLALTSTLVVLRSGRGRVNGTLYAVAFLSAETAVLILALALGVASITESGGADPTVQAVFGVALLVAAFYLRRRPMARTSDPDTPRSGSNRAAAVFSRIKRIRTIHAITGGVALGIGGPKRLGITVLAAGTIAAGGLPAGQRPPSRRCTSWWGPSWCGSQSCST